MDFNAFGAILLLSVCGLRFVEAQQWIHSGNPYNGKSICKDIGKDINLPFTYSSGYSPAFSSWYFTLNGTTQKKPIATRTRQEAVIHTNLPGYKTKYPIATGAGEAGVTVTNVQIADIGIYEVSVHFENGEYLDDKAKVQVIVKPQITESSPTALEMEQGDSKTLICAASGNPTPTITWYRDNVRIQGPSTTKRNYEVKNAGRPDKGRYRCQARVYACNGDYDYSRSYFIQVSVTYKPVVTSLTDNQTRTENSNVELACEAEGEPNVLTYYWYRGKRTDVSNSQISPSSKYEFRNSKKILVVKNLQKEDIGFYTCVASNSKGFGKGKSTYLLIQYAPSTVTITFSPSNVIDNFKTVILTCESDGFPTPTYSWRFNTNQTIGGNTKTLVQSSVNKEMAGKYTCVAQNSLGIKEGSGYLYVKYPPFNTVLTTDLLTNKAIYQQRATLTCKADGYPAPTYEIKRSTSSGVVRVHGPNGNGQYVINNVQFSAEEGYWLCVAQNSLGLGSEVSMRLIVIVAPVFLNTLPPGEPEKTENQTQNYTCTAEGKPLPYIVWRVNNENVTNETPELGEVTRITGLSSNPKLFRMESKLYIRRLIWKHYGTISCIAENDAGSRQLDTKLKVRHCPVVKTEADHPQNATVDDGKAATFRCKTIGYPVSLYNEWYFNGVKIPKSRGDTYVVTNVNERDRGFYACRGFSTLCPSGGPLFGAYLFIKTAPKIVYWPRTTIANESESARLYCEVTGIPTPEVTWRKKGNETILHVGSEYIKGNLTYEDRGIYTCTATNSEAVARAELTLVVQVVPNITTTKPMETQIPGEIGKFTPRIRCRAIAEPLAKYWWTRGDDPTHLKGGMDRVDSIVHEGENTRAIIVQVKFFGEKYFCHAGNILGEDIQEYTIREIGSPDAPIDIQVIGFQVPKKRTIDVNITWTPGYNGGRAQQFSVLYRREGAADFVKILTDSTNEYRIKELKPLTAYEFMVQSTNELGTSPNSKLLRYYTPISQLPPFRGTLTVIRNTEDGTQFFISWTLNENVTATYLQYREHLPSKPRTRRAESDQDRWRDVEGAQGLSPRDTEFTVINLNADKAYQFRVIFLYPGERLDSISDAMWVMSDVVQPVPTPKKPKSGLSTDELIAIIGAVGGVLLILLVVLCLCCFKKRKKPYGADSVVEMQQTASGPSPFRSYAAGGPDISRVSTNGRRSLNSLDVEDDPFIGASHSSISVVDGKKKKKPETGFNYGYASQDSFRQQEMLLNPGSRAGLRGMSQSMGQLETSRGGYPASGSQRDVTGTLPPYHEPPSFEEALRQSGRKSKNKHRSMGDLDNLRRTPADDMTDESSDSERYYKSKKIPSRDSDDDPGYASVDLLNGSSRSSNRNNGPPYTRPNKPRPPPHRLPPPSSHNTSSRDNPFPTDPFEDEPPGWPDVDDYNSWPPPQYTANDRAPIPGIEDDYEPRVTRRRPISNNVMELDNSYDYRGNEQLPDLPPRMPELSGSRGLLHKREPIGNDLPDPPPFLRNLDQSDDEYPPSSRSYTETRIPTSRAGRQQPYRNIHGQLVRPGSQGSDLNRNDPLRLSNSAVEPEPEPRRNRSGG